MKDADQQDVVDEAEVVLGEIVKDEPDRRIRRALDITRGLRPDQRLGIRLNRA